MPQFGEVGLDGESDGHDLMDSILPTKLLSMMRSRRRKMMRLCVL
jgi:hypothetical protein